jgi:hypothetical protein
MDDYNVVWAAIFRRKGNDGTYTKLFDRWGSAEQRLLLAHVTLRDGEVPVIGSFIDPNNWLLLTTRRLVWSTTGKAHTLENAAISEVKVDLQSLRDQRRRLTENQYLQLTTIDGERHSIELEAGAPLSGIWNVLLNICRRNNRLRQHISGKL